MRIIETETFPGKKALIRGFASFRGPWQVAPGRKRRGNAEIFSNDLSKAFIGKIVGVTRDTQMTTLLEVPQEEVDPTVVLPAAI